MGRIVKRGFTVPIVDKWYLNTGVSIGIERWIALDSDVHLCSGTSSSTSYRGSCIEAKVVGIASMPRQSATVVVFAKASLSGLSKLACKEEFLLNEKAALPVPNG